MLKKSYVSDLFFIHFIFNAKRKILGIQPKIKIDRSIDGLLEDRKMEQDDDAEVDVDNDKNNSL